MCFALENKTSIVPFKLSFLFPYFQTHTVHEENTYVYKTISQSINKN